jgi:hypothetical protein
MALPSVKVAVIKVVAEGVNSSPGNIKKTKKLSDNGYSSKAMMRALAQEINQHFWLDRNQAFQPWLHPAETGVDPVVNSLAEKVKNRPAQSRLSIERPKTGVVVWADRSGASAARSAGVDYRIGRRNRRSSVDTGWCESRRRKTRIQVEASRTV